MAGSLAYRQVTENGALAPDQDLDHRPRASRRVLGQMRFESLTDGKPLQLYVLADPAPGDDGNDDRGGELRGRAGRVGRRRSERYSHRGPGLDGDERAATAGTPERSVGGPEGATASLSDVRGQDAGNVVQGARVPISGQPGDQSTTLAIGFGQRRRRRGATAAEGSLLAGFAARGDELTTRAGPQYLGFAEGPARRASAGDARLRRLYEQSRDGARGVRGQDLPRRVHRRAEHGMDMGHAHAGRETPGRRCQARTTSSGRATSTTSRRRRRPPETMPRPRACSTTCGRVQKPDGSFWQNTRVNGTAASGRPSRWTRPRSRSCSRGGWAARARRTGRTSSRPPTTSSANGPTSDQGALGEPGRASRRTRSRPRSRV